MMPWVLVLTGLLLLLLVTQAVTHLLIKREFGRASYPEQATTAWTYEDYADDYPRERFSFMSGPNRLQGYIYGPENTRGLLVLAHGIPGRDTRPAGARYRPGRACRGTSAAGRC